MTRILVVDEAQDIGELIRVALRRAGRADVQIELATDGVEALAILRDQRFALVLTDVQMPRLDGPGLVAALAAAGDETPIVVMSDAPPPLAVPVLAVIGKERLLIELPALLDGWLS